MRQRDRQLTALFQGAGKAGIAPPFSVVRWSAAALLLTAGLVTQPLGAATFNVDSTADVVDLSPGDGVCAISNVAETVRDEFSSNSYATNAGTQNYSAAWIETGESDGVNSGRLRVLGSTRCAAGSCFRIGGDKVSINGRSITRQADLIGAISATLSYSTRRQLLDGSGGSVVVEVSGNGGSSWSTVQTINLNGSDGAQQTDSANITSSIASNTQIRFRGVGSDVESYLFVDNIQIAYTVPGDCTLRAAVQEANALAGADTINVPAGNYVLSLGGPGDDTGDEGDLDLNDTVTIAGAGLGSTSIDGNANDRVFELRGGDATITDVTITNGQIASLGGGILGSQSGTSLTLTRVAVTNNDGASGIYLKDVDPSTFTDVTVSGNTGSGDGGGVYVEAATLDWTGGGVSGHVVTGKGAGIFAKDATLTLTDVTIANNTNATTGGGLYNEKSATTITSSTFVGNEAIAGGGVGVKDGNVQIINSTFSANDSGGGAGIRTEKDTTTLTNVTVANSVGTGIRLQGGVIQARNTIVYGSSGDECRDPLTDLGNNLDGDGTCGFSTTANPQLGALQNNGGPTQTHAVLIGSPAIDAGTNTGCPATDQRGETRPADGDNNGTATCDIGAYEAKPAGFTVAGTVFEDADFAGTASAYDGGLADLPLVSVDVEIYTAADVFVASTTTVAGGQFTIAGIANGNYKLRVRSATIGDTDTPAAGGFNACVGATCANPLAEQTWANGAPAYGGRNAAVDDTATGDDAGPGDTWTAVTISGANVTGVEMGFAYNLIVNTADDANAVTARSAQGSLRQFIKNANAIGSGAGTTANSSEFRLQVASNQSNGGDAWWRITTVAALPAIVDGSMRLDGSTQEANSGSDSNTRGPEIELFGNGVAGSGVEVDGVSGTTVEGLAVNSFSNYGIYLHGAGANSTYIFGNYLGTDAVGESALGNQDFGIWVNDNVNGVNIGGALAGQGNVISGNGSTPAESGISVGLSSSNVSIRGNLIGTDRTGTAPLGNSGAGIGLTGADGVVIGGTTVAERNVIAANNGDGVRLTNFVRNVVIQGNHVGVGSGGAEINLGNGGSGVFLSSSFDPSSFVVGGLQAGEGNLIARNSRGVFTQDSGTGDQVAGNTIHDNGSHGIESASASTLIAGNLIWNNTGAGLRLRNDAGTGSSTNRVYHNTVHGNGSDGLLAEGTGIVARNNIFTGNAGFGINVSGGSVTESTNAVTDAATFPANSSGRSNGALDASTINLDPLYVDTAGGDFDLSACSSPAIDTGADLGGQQPDMNGAAAGNFNGTLPDIGAFETACTGPAVADLALGITDAPDPAPQNGPLIYSLLVTNNGSGTASGVTLTSTLPASVNFVSSNSSQGSCSGTSVVTCNLGAILNGGTASVEIQVVTTSPGSITNNASVTADQSDPVPGDNSASATTSVTTGSSFDVPLTQFQRMAGFLDHEVTGNTLRTQPNSGDACAVGASSSAAVSGIPATGTVRGAYLYWAGSGAVTDTGVTLDATAVSADRSFESDFVLGPNTYEFFGGFADVTAQVVAKRNGTYAFSGLTVDNGGIYCSANAVIAGWSLLVIYEDNSLSGKTLVVYDGFDLTRNGSTSYLLSGIYVSAPTEARTSALLWDGDEDLGGTSEQLLFNGNSLNDALNPVNNVYNSTINSLGSNTAYGMDLDSFDVSALVSEGDTLATLQVDTGPDLVILNNVVLQAKTNVIAGTVFEDVNYGGGAGRNLATSAAAAPSFAAARPGAIVELYDTAGVFLRTTTTNANGEYGFSGLPDGDYQVRVVNDSVQSARPGGGSGELPVQTYRVDGSGVALTAVTGEVGGASPAQQDSPANGSSANLGSLVAQSVAPVSIVTSITKAGIDFGYSFDTIVNTNSAGQGSLARFIANANALDNANLAQDGLTAAVEHSLFMIPSNADPLGRAADPNFDAGRGVAVISVATQLPAIVDGSTAVDGTVQTVRVGDTSSGQLGTGGTVGVDGLALSRVDAPEIEIRSAVPVAAALDLQANDTTVRGLAATGFGSAAGEAAILIANGVVGTLIEGNLLGSFADVFADPGAAQRGYTAIHSTGGDGGTIRNNLLGYGEFRCVLLDSGSNAWSIEDNEFQDCGIGSTDGDGLALDSSDSAAVSGNRIAGSSSQGIVVTGATGNSFTNNSITGNGVGTTAGVVQSAAVTLRAGASSTTFERNVIHGNYGAGIQVNNGAAGITLTRNSFADNGTIVARNGTAATGQIGIDLNAPGDNVNLGTPPFVTANDVGDADAGGNGLLNYPVIATVINTGPSTTVTGSLNAAPGASFTLEFFSGAGLHPSGHGNASVYRGSDTVITDGSGDANFSTVLPVSVPIGHAITITSTDAAGNTSEFSANGIVSTGLEIVKRAFFVDGTPIPSGSTVPDSVPFYFLLYVNNPNGARPDVSLQDVLDAAIAYEAGTLRVANSVAACASATCTPAEEDNIFAAVALAAPLTDLVDGDVGSYSAGTRTVDIGNQNAANAQLNIAANRVYALLIRVRLQ